MAGGEGTGSVVRMSRRWRATAEDLLAYVIVGSAVVAVALPFVWMVLAALKTPAEMFIVPLRWLPRRLVWSNFMAAWSALPMARLYFNTVFVASSVMILQLINASLCAYSFVGLKFPGRGALFVFFLSVMMIPAQVTIIPNYVILSRLHWIDTYAALIIPHISSVFAIFLLRQAFLGVPSDLIDAATMDGAGHFRIMFRIMVPLVRPVMVTLAVLTFTWRWNDYFWPLIMTNTMNMRTLPVGLTFMLAADDLYRGWNVLMAGSILVLLPILILFLVAQKYFVLSATRSGLHGV